MPKEWLDCEVNYWEGRISNVRPLYGGPIALRGGYDIIVCSEVGNEENT